MSTRDFLNKYRKSASILVAAKSIKCNPDSAFLSAPCQKQLPGYINIKQLTIELT